VLTIFNVHLKSRRPDFAAGEETTDPAAVARAKLRSLIRRGAERRPACSSSSRWRGNALTLIVAGDFNDDIGAVTTRIVAAAARGACLCGESAFCLSMPSTFEPRRKLSAGTQPAPATASKTAVPKGIDTCWCPRHFVPESRHAFAAYSRWRCSPITCSSAAARSAPARSWHASTPITRRVRDA